MQGESIQHQSTFPPYKVEWINMIKTILNWKLWIAYENAQSFEVNSINWFPVFLERTAFPHYNTLLLVIQIVIPVLQKEP